jgi:hypothetical protein
MVLINPREKIPGTIFKTTLPFLQTYELAEKAKVFVTGKHFQPGLIKYSSLFWPIHKLRRKEIVANMTPVVCIIKHFMDVIYGFL